IKRPYFASRNQRRRASRAGSEGAATGRSWARAAPLSARARVTAVRAFMSPPRRPLYYSSMPRRVALLLDDPENRYQQLLVREARVAAGRCDIELLDPEFAEGSSWTQVESVNRHLRETRPDGVVVMLAGEQWTRAPFERLPRAGVAVVLLNRIPDWVDALRRDHARALVAGVTPRQEGVGEIQADQALRLAPSGSFLVLVTGEASSPAAIARRRGVRARGAGPPDAH